MDGTHIRPIISRADIIITKEEVAAAFVLLILINLRRLTVVLMKRSFPDYPRSPSPVFEDAVQSLDELSDYHQYHPQQQQQQSCDFKFAAPQMPDCLRQQPQSEQQRAEQDLIGIGGEDDMEMEIGFHKIQELEERIQGIPHKPAWDMAMEMNPEYPRQR